MKTLKYIFIVFILYLFMHNPIFNFVNVGSIKLLYVFAALFFLFNKESNNAFKSYKIDLFCYSLLILYIFLRVVIGAESSMLRIIIVAFIENLILPIFIVRFYINHLSKFNFYRAVLIVGSVGAIISTAAFFIPLINTLLRDIQIINENLYYLENRGYGLSEGLTFSYSIVQAIIFYIGISNLKNNKWFILITPMLFISIVFNARTGILILVVSLLVVLMENKKTIAVAYLILFSGIVLLLLNLVHFESVNRAAYTWVREFFYEFSDIFLGTRKASYNTASVMFNDMFVIPDNLSEWILGSGDTLYAVSGGTDLGYLQKLNYGGLVLIFLYVMLIYNMSKKMLQYNVKYFLFFFLSVLLIIEIKGNFLPNSGGFRLMSLLYVFIIESKNINNSNINTI